MRADEIPVAHTPPGGWVGSPAPVLDRCTEPLVPGAVDMRGTWRIRVVQQPDGSWSEGDPRVGREQRIEQCGDRVCITAGGVVHDMRADGTEEHGVDDVAEVDKATRIRVVCTFEDGVHVLRPKGMPGIEVTRRLDGDELVWHYVGFVARLERVAS